jgi:hypothetical protein
MIGLMPIKDVEKRREYQREYMRTWYRENKATHIAYVRNREAKIKAWLKEYKASIGCEAAEKHTRRVWSFITRTRARRRFRSAD